ncbi:MAG: murein transglycosylase A [Proteobacteria bacterium]|nr:murein transglycosylase A [Pseudomonadota bacterium]
MQLRAPRPDALRARLVLLGLFLIAAAGLTAWWYLRPQSPPETLSLSPADFDDLPGWKAENLSDALRAFRGSCRRIVALPPDKPMAYAGTAGDWRRVCDAASAASDPRSFFEKNFVPYSVDGGNGLVTGYYEPLLRGSATRHGHYQTPVYGLPDDLLTIDLGAFRPEWKGEKVGARIVGKKILPYPSRAEIDADPPKSAAVLFYGDDPISVFFLHIQGSGRVALDNGKTLRVTYAGQNGQPYTAIGRTLIHRGVPRDGMSMQVVRDWLKDHPDDAQAVMESDASFVFFQVAPVGDPALGPPGTEGVPLTPRGSIAVDSHIHPFGLPVYIAGGGLADLFIAQDTGGAIRGPARADIFYGFGPKAETTAGGMKARAAFFVLLPKGVTPKLSG